MKKHLIKFSAWFILLVFSLSTIILSGDRTVSAQSPVDPNANSTVRNIINYLNNATYAGKSVVGAFQYIGNSDPLAGSYYEKIEEKFGVSCGIFSACYSLDRVNHKFDYAEANRQIIEHYNEGAIIMLHNANEWGDDCMSLFPDEDPTLFLRNFDSTYKDRNQSVYERYLGYRKSWSDGIEELQKAGVTVIYRPFVEMNNFNFPATYAPTADGKEYFKRIWRQNYDYMVNERGLHNIVWNFSPATLSAEGNKYYPGDEYVDVIAPTFYAGGATGTSSAEAMMLDYKTYASYGKPMGFSELGCHLDYKSGEQGDWERVMATIKYKMPRVSFFALWTNQTGLFSSNTVNADKFINDDRLLTLEDVAVYKNEEYASSGTVALFTQKNYGGDIKTFDEGSYDASKLNSLGAMKKAFASLRVTNGYSVTFYKSKDCSGEGMRFITDVADFSDYNFSYDNIGSLKIEKMEIVNASLNKPVISSDPDSDPKLINDGTLDYWETYKCNPDSWVVIDLKDVYTVNRWEVTNIGSYGEMSDSNAVNYRFQYSTDCKTWKDGGVVFGNNADTTSQEIKQVDAQYVRLYVEVPNSSTFDSDKTRCAICEFTVYGVKKADGKSTDWTLLDLSENKNNGKNNNTGNSSNSQRYAPSENTENTESGDNGKTVIKNVVLREKSKKSSGNSSSSIYWIISGIVVLVSLAAAATIIIINKRKT